jgi:hypothetical protein
MNQVITQSKVVKLNLSIKDIADKHKTSVAKIETQIKMGVKVEMEHVNDKRKQKKLL